MNVAEMIAAAHENARDKGFWDAMIAIDKAHFEHGLDGNDATELHNAVVAQKLALIATEVMEFEAEAFERRPDSMLEELADVVIRVFDLAGFLDVPIAETVLSGRLHLYSTATGTALALHRSVARCVQAHRKGGSDVVLITLEDVVRIAQDYASYMFEDSYALRRAIERKMQLNQSREHKHGNLY